MDIVAYEDNTTGADVPINETVVRLECGHAFHSTCIALSLRQGIACPMCRAEPKENFMNWNITLARPLEEETEIVRLSTNLIQEIEADTMHLDNISYARL
jgi:hypothetical protein